MNIVYFFFFFFKSTRLGLGWGGGGVSFFLKGRVSCKALGTCDY